MSPWTTNAQPGPDPAQCHCHPILRAPVQPGLWAGPGDGPHAQQGTEHHPAKVPCSPGRYARARHSAAPAAPALNGFDVQQRAAMLPSAPAHARLAFGAHPNQRRPSPFPSTPTTRTAPPRCCCWAISGAAPLLCATGGLVLVGTGSGRAPPMPTPPALRPASAILPGRCAPSGAPMRAGGNAAVRPTAASAAPTPRRCCPWACPRRGDGTTAGWTDSRGPALRTGKGCGWDVGRMAWPWTKRGTKHGCRCRRTAQRTLSRASSAQSVTKCKPIDALNSRLARRGEGSAAGHPQLLMQEEPSGSGCFCWLQGRQGLRAAPAQCEGTPPLCTYVSLPMHCARISNMHSRFGQHVHAYQHARTPKRAPRTGSRA